MTAVVPEVGGLGHRARNGFAIDENLKERRGALWRAAQNNRPSEGHEVITVLFDSKFDRVRERMLEGLAVKRRNRRPRYRQGCIRWSVQVAPSVVDAVSLQPSGVLHRSLH